MKLLDEGANLGVSFTRDLTTTGVWIPLQFPLEVNLRTIIGKEEYDNNEYFGICLNSVALYMLVSTYTILGVPGVFGNNTAVQVKISGLPFITSSSNGTVTNSVYFPDKFTIGGGNTDNVVYNSFNFSNPKTKCLIFRKPKNSVVTLEIGLYNIINNDLPLRAGNSVQPVNTTTDLSFSIFPAVEE
jgi:hypothetical protein